jgi:hypothetical protein
MQKPSPVSPAQFAGLQNKFSACSNRPVGFEILLQTYKIIKLKYLKTILPASQLTDARAIPAASGSHRSDYGDLHNAKLARLFLQNASEVGNYQRLTL